MSSFLTIEAPAEGLYREKMSKFISFAVPVSSAQQAKEEIERIRNLYHDARHVCWAYMTGADRSDYQSNDNGEPSGTAGRPILGQINSFSLTNILIVVVRYFGGIKLGTSGLIVAYRTAAREAILAAKIVEDKEMDTMVVSFPYEAMNEVMRITKHPDISIISRQFDNLCTITILLPRDLTSQIAPRLSDIPQTSVAQSR